MALQPALQRMRQAWNDAAMDCLLLLARKDRSTGFDGPGDFDVDEAGRLARRSGETADHVYAGAYLVHPRLFGDAPEGPFSMNQLWNQALAKGRLHGLVHNGWWLHVGTPDAIALAEDKLRQLGQP
jgi:MurNAc alpha-1-phosphate uridylyltransferase